MKNILFLFSFFLLSTFCFAQTENFADLATELKKGSELHYTVNTGSTSYAFIVKLESINFPQGITFEYSLMSSSPKNAKVTMTDEALQAAETMYNFFSGEDIELEDRVSVFLSQAMFENENPVRIKLDINDPEFTNFYRSNDVDVLKTNIGNISTRSLVNDDLNYKIEYADNAACPLIINMDLGWTVKLDSIKL
ncbi:MAG: hypothetical protein R2739_10835 [Chitinophagales bacterium]|nr:hypothetical protein [Bacteroidota bacterium]